MRLKTIHFLKTFGDICSYKTLSASTKEGRKNKRQLNKYLNAVEPLYHKCIGKKKKKENSDNNKYFEKIKKYIYFTNCILYLKLRLIVKKIVQIIVNN